jgi:hypothetical protein
MMTPLPRSAELFWLVQLLAPASLTVLELEPDRVAVEMAENVAESTAVVRKTLTVAVPTSTVKYDPAGGIPRPAELMYETKLRVNIQESRQKCDGGCMFKRIRRT